MFGALVLAAAMAVLAGFSLDPARRRRILASEGLRDPRKGDYGVDREHVAETR